MTTTGQTSPEGVPLTGTGFGPHVCFAIVITQNTWTTKLLMTLEVTEIIGGVFLFLLYLHR